MGVLFLLVKKQTPTGTVCSQRVAALRDLPPHGHRISNFHSESTVANIHTSTLPYIPANPMGFRHVSLPRLM
jgi:hypothetical protein